MMEKNREGFFPLTTRRLIFVVSIMFEGFYTTSLVAPFVCAILVSCAYKRYTSLMARARYPPGPPRLPIIGSLLHVPNRHTWLAYERMGKDLGESLPVVSLDT